MDILEAIHSRVSPSVSALLNHTFFEFLETGDYQKKDLRVFAEQYYCISRAFNNFLFFACTSVPNEAHRLPLIENIYDEHGRGDVNKSHRKFLWRFLKAVGSSSSNAISPLPSTSANIYGMEKLCCSGDVMEIFGALGPGCEAFTADQYKRVFDALLSSGHFSRDDLFFFEEHIRHDPHHTKAINDVIVNLAKTNIDINKIVQGAEKAILFETMFWDGIYKQTVLEKANRGV